MTHNFLTDDVVTPFSLDMFEATMVAANHTDRRFEAIFGTHGGSNRSDTIRIRKPNFVQTRRGWDAVWRDYDEQYTTLTFGDPIGHDLMLTEKEMHMDLTTEGKQIVQPVMNQLAHDVDAMVIDELMTAPNYVGIPGISPNALSTYLNGEALINDYCCPDDGEILCAISPQMDADIVDALKGLTQDDEEIKRQYKTGRMKRAAGLKWARTQQSRTHTTGSVAGSGLVNQPASLANGCTSIALDDFTATQTGVVKLNDIYAFDGMYAVTPIGKQSTSRLKTVRATADADSDGSGNVTLYFNPPLYFSGPNQNVSAQPTNNGVVYLFGSATAYASTTTRQGLMWHKSAVALAFQKLENPQGEGAKGRAMTDEKLGLSIRYTRSWDIDKAKWKLRWDVWPAVKLVRDEWAARVQGAS